MRNEGFDDEGLQLASGFPDLEQKDKNNINSSKDKSKQDLYSHYFLGAESAPVRWSNFIETIKNYCTLNQAELTFLVIRFQI